MTHLTHLSKSSNRNIFYIFWGIAKINLYYLNNYEKFYSPLNNIWAVGS